MPQATTGRADAFAGERADEEPDVEHDVGHDEIGAAPLPQIRERQLDGSRVGDLRAFLHGDFGRCADLAAETAHN